MFLFLYLSLREKESLHLFFNPQKAKNDDKVTFLERISEKYLVTFGNFCNFAAHLTNMFFMFIASGVCNSARSVDWID